MAQEDNTMVWKDGKAVASYDPEWDKIYKTPLPIKSGCITLDQDPEHAETSKQLRKLEKYLFMHASYFTYQIDGCKRSYIFVPGANTIKSSNNSGDMDRCSIYPRTITLQKDALDMGSIITIDGKNHTVEIHGKLDQLSISIVMNILDELSKQGG